MKKRLIWVIISAVVFAAGFTVDLIIKPNARWVELCLFLPAYLLSAYGVLWACAKNIVRGRIFDENVLMAVATAGALAIGQYPEAVAVMLFYLVGEMFQSYAVEKSKGDIARAMDIRPEYANIKTADGGVQRVDPREVKIGDIIVVAVGEKIPLDGVVMDGSSTLDTSALTGESMPRAVAAGDVGLSGCINAGGVITIRVEAEFGESTVSKILDLVENAGEKKAKAENFITKFAAVYTPIVMLLAVVLAVVPSLITGAWSEWIYRALTFLVISCPCALVVSIPMSFFGGIGGAARRGILIKGGNYLDALARTEIAVFDKTGTLTKGEFAVQEIHPVGISRDELLKFAAHAECYSLHPISAGLRTAYGKKIDKSKVRDIQEIAGQGVKATVFGRAVLLGSAKLVAGALDADTGTVVHVSIDGKYAGYITIADEIKPDSVAAIAGLKALGVKQTVMLTGDSDAVGQKIGTELGLDTIYTELLPAGKVEKLEELLTEKTAGGALVFVGDGINDAPVLTRADIGIAMGGMGSAAAVEAADIVFMTDQPLALVTAIKISRRTHRIVSQNIALALGVKFAALALAAFGIATMWQAVIADVGVTVLAVLNAFRALRTKKL